MIKNSLIYIGKVIHRRFKPKEHYFKYNVFSLLIDLEELEAIQNKIKIFSYNKFNIISFFDKDHGPRDDSSLKPWVIKNLKDIGIENDKIQIKLLCYPRIFGYVFNPLSVFFIYDEKTPFPSVYTLVPVVGIVLLIMFADKETLYSLENSEQILFRYSEENGEITEKSNPNGSLFNIAGIMNSEGNVLGMMPHPERCCEDEIGGTDGSVIFNSIIHSICTR